MRKLLLLAIFVCATFLAPAQNINVGNKAPDLKVREWVRGAEPHSKAYLLEFFYSANKTSVEKLAELNALATKHKNKLDVVVITKQTRSEIESYIKNFTQLKVALDDNSRTFDAYDVKYVPYSVLISNKGRVLWMGNSRFFDESVILDYL